MPFEVDVTDTQVEFFRTNGFLSIDRITTDEEMESLSELYDETFDAGGAAPGLKFDLARAYDSEGENLLPQVLFPEQKHPEFHQTLAINNGRRIASKLLGVPIDELLVWGHMIVKPPRIGHETPWHQDEAYWDGRLSYHALGMWVPLDEATVESGCMQFIPGSHTQRIGTHAHIGDDPTVHGLHTLEEVDTSKAVPCPLHVGGATFHHCRILHYTGPNTTDRTRRAWANEFQAAPVPAQEPEERPWVSEGMDAYNKREVFKSR